MNIIKKISAMEILNSRGEPTVETTIVLGNDITAIASVPSGASVGKYEALELRDDDPTRYSGLGVLKAVNNVNHIIAPKITGNDVVQQGKIDQMMIEMDGTDNKSNLGANAILSVSLAVCKAAALAVEVPLYKYVSEMIGSSLPTSNVHMPTPTFNIINGGKHGSGNLDFQEFHVIPSTIKPYHEALRIGDEIYLKLKDVLTARNAVYSVGDEGGYAPNLYTNMDALEAIMEAIRMTRYKFGFDVFLGLDIAATHLKHENSYSIKDRPIPMGDNEFIDFLSGLHQEYHLLILEDPLAEDDWQAWKKITQRLDQEVIITGDDLITTNIIRLKKAISEKACSAIIVKPNQIGTLSETLSVIKEARNAGLKIIVSHRSGETNDTFIADMAVGIKAEYIKFGAPARGERVAKYNRLLYIEKELGLS